MKDADQLSMTVCQRRTPAELDISRLMRIIRTISDGLHLIDRSNHRFENGK